MNDDKPEYEAPSTTIWDRLAQRITADAGEASSVPDAAWTWQEPAWAEAGPGVTYKVLATDEARKRVSLVVKLAPGAAYPPHTHADVEELHLLDGELWIDDRKLLAGDHNRAEPGTADARVWSETGCTCVLLTSSQDLLR